MDEIRLFEQHAQRFNKVTIAQVNEKLQSNEELILFIGRETCPYCRKFAKTLVSLLDLKPDLLINFLHSMEPKEDLEQIQTFRNTYAIPTVPGFLVKKGDAINVRCDSSLSIDKLIELIQS